MSDLAKQLIAENKRSKATSLDLGNCGLTEVPAEVEELVWLEYLTFASEWCEWEDGRWLKKMKSRNAGGKNNCLADTGPFDLGPLNSLSALQKLFVSDIQLSDLTPLASPALDP